MGADRGDIIMNPEAAGGKLKHPGCIGQYQVGMKGAEDELNDKGNDQWSKKCRDNFQRFWRKSVKMKLS